MAEPTGGAGPGAGRRRARVASARDGAQDAAPARPYHHGAVRERLVAEALALAGESGAAGVSLREAARRVGVSHAAAYHHFSDRAGLIAAAATEGMWRLAAALERAERDEAGDPAERVCRISAAYVDFALGEPAAFRLMFATEVAHKARFPELRAASDAAAAPLLRALQLWRGEASGAIGEDVRQLAVTLWSLVHGLSVLALDRQLDEGELRVPAGDRAGSPRELASRATRLLLAAEREAREQ